MSIRELGDGRRFALAIRLERHTGGTLRLVFDDLIAEGDSEGRSWRKWSFYTHLDVPEVRARTHQLEEKEYMAIGEAVMARLIALLEVANGGGSDHR
jgi:hypothetical protein